MKKRLTFITLLMLFCSTMFGQKHWEMTQKEKDKYQNKQTICISVLIDNVEQNVEGLEIAAFHYDVLRGVGVTASYVPTQTYIAIIPVYGTTLNEEISLKLYDPRSGKELSSDYVFDWDPNVVIYPYDPIPVNFYEKHWNDMHYENCMSLVCQISINGEIQNRTDLELAAFCGEEFRGTTRVKKLGDVEVYLATILIEGKDGETINFRLYDPTIDMELTTDYTVQFDTEAMPGDEEKITMNFSAPVVKINETAKYYYTLAEAVNEAEAGQTITLLGEAQGSGIVIDKSLTIDFKGFTYTFTDKGVGSGDLTSNGFQILEDKNVTLMNGGLKVAEEMSSVYYILIQNYANLTVDNMTLDGTNLDKWSATDGDSYVLSNNSGNVNVSNTTIIANNDGNLAFALDACYNPSYTAPVVTLGENVIVQGKVEVTGGQLYSDAALEAVVRKTVEGTTEGWGTLSSPTQEGTAVFNTEGQHDFYQYVESAELEWNNLATSIVDNSYKMEAGRGYLYANTNDTKVSFDGTLNNKTVNHTLSYTEKDLAGFNLIGNPFTHNISFAHLSGNIGDGYYVVSADGAFTAVEPSAATDVIAPFEAVLVQTTEDDATLAINKKAARTREATNGVLEIVVANANYSDVAYVSFNEGLGLEKLGHHNANIPLVYVNNNDKNFAIAKLTQDVNEIPVSFEAKEMGSYTISVKAIDCEFKEMYLTDKLTGEKANLLMEDYTFVATSNDNADRFVISFATTKPESVAENFIYMNNGNMIINNIEGDAVVRVLDVLGRPVAEYNIAESANISTAEFAAGIYVVRMTDGNGVKVQKIIID